MSQNAPAPLTGLERELLACVERLTMASEASAEQFAALERRSTGQVNERLSALESCFGLLLRSQITLTSAFASLARVSNIPAPLQPGLDEAEAALTEAAKLLSRTGQ
jgi:hypothetical protein